MRGWHVCPNWHKSCSHLEGGWESDLPGWLSGMAGKGVASSPPYIVGLRPRSVPLPGIASAWNFLTAFRKWGLRFRYAISLDIVSENLSAPLAAPHLHAWCIHPLNIASHYSQAPMPQATKMAYCSLRLCNAVGQLGIFVWTICPNMRRISSWYHPWPDIMPSF